MRFPEGLGGFYLSTWALDPFNGSTGLANERNVFVPVKIITEFAALTTRGYDHQGSQCGAEL